MEGSAALSMRIRTAALTLLPVLVMIVPFGSPRCGETDNWEAYLEYYDPGRKASLSCYYDRSRIIEDHDAGTVQVWEKLLPSDLRASDTGDIEESLPEQITNHFEVNCVEKSIRIIETYSQYEDNVVTYSLEVFPWQRPSIGSREDQLVQVVCRKDQMRIPQGGLLTRRPLPD